MLVSLAGSSIFVWPSLPMAAMAAVHENSGIDMEDVEMKMVMPDECSSREWEDCNEWSSQEWEDCNSWTSRSQHWPAFTRWQVHMWYVKRSSS